MTPEQRRKLEQLIDLKVSAAGQGAGMSASDTLRRAAKVLREHAEAAQKAMDPTVGLALADWLDTAGADWWAHGGPHCDGGCMECDDDLVGPHLRRAMAVARAILREAEDA